MGYGARVNSTPVVVWFVADSGVRCHLSYVFEYRQAMCGELTHRRLFTPGTLMQNGDEVYAVLGLLGRSRLVLYLPTFFLNYD